jgi:hypothetical protein
MLNVLFLAVGVSFEGGAGSLQDEEFDGCKSVAEPGSRGSEAPQ